MDRISDQVILLSHGYVVAEGQIQGVRGEVKDQPMQILVRCDQPSLLAAQLFQQDHVVEAKIHTDGKGLLLRTTRRRRLLPAAEPHRARVRPGGGIGGARRMTT